MMRSRWSALFLCGSFAWPLGAQDSVGPGSLAGPAPSAAGTPAVQNTEAGSETQDAGDPGDGPADAPDVERFAGTFEEGTRELRRLALEGDTDGALALSDSLLVPGPLADLRARAERRTGGTSERVLESLAQPLDWLGLPIDEGTYRAEVHYARGLVFALRSEIAPSNESFELARVLAGPGKTRLDAIYNQGNLDFAGGEALRQMIPEIVGEEEAVEPPEDLSEDPLELARAAYLAAREHFVERLRAEWRDGDTRANLELTLRRLRELDEVERQREEQEQQEQEQEQDSENSDEQDEQKDDSSDSQEGSEDESDEQEPSEEESEEQEPDEGEEQDPEEDEESTGEESEEDPDPEDAPEESKQEPEEKHLTAEEVKRLLERLQELDQKGEELRERLRGVRRVPVKRDW